MIKNKQCFNCGKALQGFNNKQGKTKYDTCSKCESKLNSEKASTSLLYQGSANNKSERAPINEKNIKAILQNITVLCDSREKQNNHILNYFKEKKITYKIQKLDSGDYSFILPSMPEHGIPESISFENKIIIERKNSLEELSGNFCGGRERFNNEFLRIGEDCRKILIIERGSLDGILNGEYRTGFDCKAYLASLLSFKCRYAIDIHFVSKENIGKFVYATFYYHAREFLLGGYGVG